MASSYKDHNNTNVEAVIDSSTDAVLTIGQAHHEKHDGADYYIMYSVVSLGAMTTPNDMITLTFTTPDTAKWSHFTFRVTGTGGWRVRVIEAPTGGAETPTGSLVPVNSNRNVSHVSTLIDLASAANSVSYDATLATGGVTLWDEYIAGSAHPQAGGGSAGHDEEVILKQDTKYQISLFGTDTDPATLRIAWYEHTNR